MQRTLSFALWLVVLVLLAACGGGSGGQSLPSEPQSTQPVTFLFRVPGAGPLETSQDFRYATTSATFIAKARAQLALPMTGHKLFPSGQIASGNGGVNFGWDWHFSDLDLVDKATPQCDGTPARVQQDLANWANKTFCPQRGFVLAELGQVHFLADMAVGRIREIHGGDLTIELRDVVDSRCGSAMICLSQIVAGAAQVELLVRRNGAAPQTLTVAEGSSQAAEAFGYEITLQALKPYPVSGPWPKEVYRADITVRKL